MIGLHREASLESDAICLSAAVVYAAHERAT